MIAPRRPGPAGPGEAVPVARPSPRCTFVMIAPRRPGPAIPQASTGRGARRPHVRVLPALDPFVAAGMAVIGAVAVLIVGTPPCRRSPGPTLRVRHDGDVDRKSTRLNSSHANISY